MISVTTLSGYQYCPRKLFLQYVLRLVPIPKVVLVLGSVKHEVFDGINKVEENIVKSITKKIQMEDILNRYRSDYGRILKTSILKFKRELRKFDISLSQLFKDNWPIFLEEAHFRAKNIHGLIEEKNVFGEELWELLPKIKSEFRVESEKLGLRGIVDKIEFRGKLVIPFELKTGKAPTDGVWPGHKTQIAAYMLMLEEAFNTEIKEGFIQYLGVSDLRKVVMNPFLKMEIIELKHKVQDLLNSKVLPPICKNENKCNACGLKDDCFNEKLVNEKLSTIQ